MTKTKFGYKEDHDSAMVRHVRLIKYASATGGILNCIIYGIIPTTTVTPELAAEINDFVATHGHMHIPFSAYPFVAHINDYYAECCKTPDKFPIDLFLDGLKTKYYVAKEIADSHHLHQQQRKEMLTKITPTKVTAMIKCISPAGVERIAKFLDPTSTMDINELFNRAYEHAEVMLEYMPNEKVGLSSFIAEESDFIYVHSI